MSAVEAKVEPRKRKFDGVAHLFYYWSDSRPDGKVWVGGTNDMDEKMRRDQEAFKRYKTGQGKWQPCFQLVQYPDVQASVLETLTDLPHDVKKAREEMKESRDHALSVFQMDTARDHEDEDEKMDGEEASKQKKRKQSIKHAPQLQEPQKEYEWKVGPCPWPECTHIIKDHPERHARKHTKEKPFMCSDCDYKAAQKGDVDRHAVTVHGGERPFVCSECNFNSPYKQSLKQHVTAAHTNERPFACSECDYKASANTLLNAHIRIVHRRERRFACLECCYKASQKQALNQHVRAVHRRERSFACSECDYKATQKQNLVHHVRTVHRGERRFACSDCDFKTTTNQKLGIHVKSMHTAEGQRRQKKSEEMFFRDLKAANVIVDERERVLSFACLDSTGKFARIDGVLQKPKHKFMLENDEHGHEGLPVKCEVERMINVHTTQQITDPERATVFVRFNPDVCHIGGKKLKILRKERMAKLVTWLNSYTPTLPFEMHYWWYDQDEDGVLEVTKDSEFPEELRKCAFAHK